MLTLNTRPQFHTLLDSISLQEPDDRAAIVYLETGRAPIVVTRRIFCGELFHYAAALQQLGIVPRDLVIIAHTQNLESIYAFWGAMLAGAIPSMFPTLTEKLDAAVYRRNMAELIRLSNARAVLTTDAFANALRPHVPCPVYGSVKVQRSGGAGEQGSRGAEEQGESPNLSISNLQSLISSLQSLVSTSPCHLVTLSPPHPSDIAFLQHSSGTTGLQKGVALSHTAVLNQLAAYSDAISLRENDVVVSWLPLYHDMGLIAGFLLPLVQGIPLVLMSPFDWVQHPALLFRAIHDYQGTLCWLPNFAYNHCARRIRRRDLEGLSAASMQMFINCSEPVRYDSHRLFLDRFAANGVRPEMLAVSYAMAENTFGVTQTSPGQPARLDLVDRKALAREGYARPVAAGNLQAQVRVSCGRPIPDTEVRIVDDSGLPLAERQVGEIAIRSNCLLAGYYNRPDLQPFRDGWYLTGDTGYMADGELYVIGRLKDLIINAGKNIYPEDIEVIVNEIPGVHPGRVVAFGVLDEREGTELIAVVAEVEAERMESGDWETKRLEIGRLIRQEVARQSGVTVSYVHLVGPKWLLKTSSGKIARAANRDKWFAEQSNSSL